jgi:hypothetical protein
VIAGCADHLLHVVGIPAELGEDKARRLVQFTHQSAIKTTILLYKATVSAIGVE